MAAARKEFCSQGFAKASTNRICAEAGVTTGALFKRYKNKDELFCALVADTAETFKAMLEGEEVSEEVIRYLIGMQQHALFEIIKKQTDYEQACKHATQVQSFFDLAWAGLFKL